MRIIAGEAGGIRLKSIKGTPTRPTLDRVKESIFNMLAPYLRDTIVIDLFAGFGNLGLEAVSRGAKKAVFVEKNRKNIKVIKENVKICGFDDRVEIIQDDVFHYFKQTKGLFNIIFLDPPYGQGLAQKTLAGIKKNQLLVNRGLVVVEHSKNDTLKTDLPFNAVKTKVYGDTSVTIFQQGEE